MRFLLPLLCCLVLCAQDNEVAIGYGWTDEGEGAEAWRDHYGDEDGLFLESLSVDFGQKVDGLDRLSIDASGFGARPFGRARVRLSKDEAWKAELRYREQTSERTSLDGVRNHDWELTTLRAAFTYEGNRHVRVRLRGYDSEREGVLGQWFYGLAQPYGRRLNVRDRFSEYGLALETRSLPVKVVLEQSLSRYRRERGISPANDGLAQDPTTNLFSGAETPGRDDTDAPTTRLGLSYAEGRFSVAASALFRKDDLDVQRDDVTVYDIAGGSVGQMVLGNQLEGVGSQDTNQVHVRMAAALGKGWILRFQGDHLDRSASGALLGSKELSAGGIVVAEEPVAADTVFDRTEQNLLMEVEWRQPKYSISAGYEDLSWERSWRNDEDAFAEDEERDSEAVHLRANFYPIRGLRGYVAYSSGTFGNAIFRNDPDETDSLEAKVRYKFKGNVSVGLQFSRESSERELADEEPFYNRDLDSAGLQLAWGDEKGRHVSISASKVELETNTWITFYAPELVGSFSNYHSDLALFTGHVLLPINQRFKFTGMLSHYNDDGASVPMHHTDASLRLDVTAVAGTECGLFLRRYDHYGPAAGIFYEVDHYGITCRKRF